MIHSKSDAIFLFGKGAVSLSSPQTINLDSNEKVLIDSPKIELGNRAEELGEPVVKGVELTIILQQMMTALTNAGVLLSQVSDSEPGASAQAISSAGQIISEETTRLISVLGLSPQTSPILSNVTYTR
jgi:hypothetical protein